MKGFQTHLCQRLVSQDPEFNNTDQIDLYDDVLTATSQPSDDRSSSTEPPPPVRQEPSPKPNNKTPAILYTYSGLRNRRAAVYVGSFSWVSMGNQKGLGGLEGEHWEVMAFSETTVALFCALMGLDFFFLGSGWIDL